VSRLGDLGFGARLNTGPRSISAVPGSHSIAPEAELTSAQVRLAEAPEHCCSHFVVSPAIVSYTKDAGRKLRSAMIEFKPRNRLHRL
jgi:hypothetical protein